MALMNRYECRTNLNYFEQEHKPNQVLGVLTSFGKLGKPRSYCGIFQALIRQR